MSNPGWEETTLGELVRFNQNSVKKPDPDALFTYVDISSTTFEEGIDSHSLVKMPFSKAPSRAKRLVHEGDVLLSTVRPNLRAMARVGKNQDGYVASTGFAVMRTADEETLLQDFLWILVRDEHFTNHLVNLATGSNYPAVKVKDISSYSLVLPPPQSQREIVDFMRTLDSLDQAGNREIYSAESLRKNLINGLWNEAVKEGWTPTRLKDIGKTVTGGTPKTAIAEYWNAEEIPFYTPGDMDFRGSEVTPARASRFTSKKAHVDSRKKFDGYAAAQVCIGSSVGKSGFFASPALFNQQLNAVVGLEQADALLLSSFLSTEQFHNQMRGSTGTTALPIASKGRWEVLQIPWSESADERERFSFTIQTLDAYLESAKRSQEALKQVRKDALHALLSGDKDVRELAEMFSSVQDVA